jgi:hypothetical protein
VLGDARAAAAAIGEDDLAGQITRLLESAPDGNEDR